MGVVEIEVVSATEEGDTFWGYTSVPSDGVIWWKALPTSLPFSTMFAR